MSGERNTILIVYDNLVNISFLEKILNKSGYDTFTATGGEEALEVVDKNKPDLVLLDVMMPQMDGFEVCEKLKSSHHTDDIPIIFLSAKTETEALVRGFDVGGADYITKPFQRAELLARVKTHITIKKMQVELLEQNVLLAKLARTDPLTGVYNRRFFIEALEREFARSRRYENPLSLLIIDADHFKSINDLYGHDTGDSVLKALCDAGRGIFRKTDFFARIGGEEFAVILPHTDQSKSHEVAERFLKRIEELTVKSEKGDVNFTVSIGIASIDEQTKEMENLMKKADKALYLAKENGKNRIEAY
jgi:diguanylate cyclase (GGDEF)-like protein